MILHSNPAFWVFRPIYFLLGHLPPLRITRPYPSLKVGSCRIAKLGILTSHVCSWGGLTQGRETESLLGSHLSPGPLLGFKQQKEEKWTVIKVRQFTLKESTLSATGITQEEGES